MSFASDTVVQYLAKTNTPLKCGLVTGFLGVIWAVMVQMVDAKVDDLACAFEPAPEQMVYERDLMDLFNHLSRVRHFNPTAFDRAVVDVDRICLRAQNILYRQLDTQHPIDIEMMQRFHVCAVIELQKLRLSVERKSPKDISTIDSIYEDISQCIKSRIGLVILHFNASAVDGKRYL